MLDKKTKAMIGNYVRHTEDLEPYSVDDYALYIAASLTNNNNSNGKTLDKMLPESGVKRGFYEVKYFFQGRNAHEAYRRLNNDPQYRSDLANRVEKIRYYTRNPQNFIYDYEI